ncbi:type II secretion system inner membrane protein GspF [Uliginosibacterium sp. 31-16]|uniref:type II secretion system inner membrane protein GspF n=1 Tax=Uliginosibacterium sp. 31-16 TaxID=3068315 RepID=UPI00273E5D8C|nr:type II secretion system inner membrane protein GspF [Uliginosibacterium sp. 31-16]MDP5240920.1 type II secretion system inner membrane protein GspF [Uliginosibacterium sp. 31-16]
MAGFTYQVLSSSDKGEKSRVEHGRIEADSARHARMLLREQGLIVVDIKEERANTGRTLRLGGASLATLTRQLAGLLDAGLAIDEALTVLGEQSENKREKTLLTLIRQDIATGLSLSAALARFERVFPPFYRALVRAGEESGKLPGVLLRLADYLERREELKSRLAMAFIYPACVILVSVAVIIGMLTWVVPQMVQVFQGAKQILPLPTRILLGTSQFLGAWGGWIFLLLIIGLVIFLRAMKQEDFRFKVHAKRLRLPWFGRLERSAETVRFASTLAILAGSGVPVLTAMSAASGVMSNLPLKAGAEQAARQVREGVSLARALAAAHAFPPILVHLVASGEATGRLDAMLERAAAEQSAGLSRRVETFSALLGPAVVLIMGAVVLFIVLAILLPVFEMNQLIK